MLSSFVDRNNVFTYYNVFNFVKKGKQKPMVDAMLTTERVFVKLFCPKSARVIIGSITVSTGVLNAKSRLWLVART